MNLGGRTLTIICNNSVKSKADEAKSLSFNKMNEEEFEKLYSNIIDASLEVLPDTMSKDDLESAALEILSYV